MDIGSIVDRNWCGSKRLLEELKAIPNVTAAKARLADAESELWEKQVELDKLQDDVDALAEECELLCKLIPKWEEFENSPEEQVRRAVLAAVANPNQVKFPFYQEQGW